MESKKDIRKEVLALRNSLSKRARNKKSLKIYEKVINHPFFLNADTLFCYVDYQNEVETCEIIKRAWMLGKRVAVPKVEGMSMLFYEIHDFSDLEEGYKGILEPKSLKLADAQNGLVIMPGVAFDTARNRIGYGKGYYDRYLSQHPQLNTIAVAFELQIREQIPCKENDIKPEIIITEEKVYV